MSLVYFLHWVNLTRKKNLFFFSFKETAIWWIVVDTMVPHSSKNLRSLWEEYIKELVESEFAEPRSIYCAGLVNEMMGRQKRKVKKNIQQNF